MFDRYNRHIHYLRISVTDRCNLRCRYCMPEEGVRWVSPDEILTFEEITDVVKAAVSAGIDKFRLTGGEPLVRKNITRLVAMIAEVKGVKDLGMTTNGLLLKQYATDLKKAGLHRVNISLDTTDPEKFRQITRGGDIREVLEGIEAARNARLSPLKLNCVVLRSSDEEDARLVRKFAEIQGLQVRFIRQMDLDEGDFSVVEGGTGGDCSICNRLRLTANGMLKPCLFSDHEFPVRKLGADVALAEAVRSKPLKGCYNNKGSFYNIGG